MDLTPEALQAIFISFDLRYQSAYLSAKPFFNQIANEIPSATRETHYGWLGKIPKMREWLGERVVNNVSAREYTIKNKDYEDTIALKRNDVKDDQIGLYTPALDMLGQQARLWPDQLISSLIQSGAAATALSFDDQPFFSSTHPQNLDAQGGAVESNIFTAMPLTAANFAAVVAAMMTFTGEDGQPLGVNPTMLMVPPALAMTARTILNAEIIATPVSLPGGGAGAAMQSNVLKGTADLLVNPYLAANPTTWYVLDTSKPIKPFVFQLREAPQFTYLNQPTDSNVFFRREFIMGVNARGNAGYGLWFLAAMASA
jgi:phage major head subunit gpT-like protein